MSQTIDLSICLSDIPESHIRTSNNGKRYVNLILDERKSVGNYGETHSIRLNQFRHEPDGKVYVGSGKLFVYDNPERYEVESTDTTDLDKLSESELDKLLF